MIVGGATSGILHEVIDEATHRSWKNEEISGTTCNAATDHFPPGYGIGSRIEATTCARWSLQGVQRNWGIGLAIGPSGCNSRITPGRAYYRADDPGVHWAGGSREAAIRGISSEARGISSEAILSRLEWLETSHMWVLEACWPSTKFWGNLGEVWTTFELRHIVRRRSAHTELRSWISLMLRAMWT